jgi:hypothetical protein
MKCWFLVQGYFAHKNRSNLAPYSKFISRALWWFCGGWRMSEVPL